MRCKSVSRCINIYLQSAGLTTAFIIATAFRIASRCSPVRWRWSRPRTAKKVGLSDSTLHLMEMAEQNVTLKTLELSQRLKCSVGEMLGED
jgi:hypothetical protein